MWCKQSDNQTSSNKINPNGLHWSSCFVIGLVVIGLVHFAFLETFVNWFGPDQKRIFAKWTGLADQARSKLKKERIKGTLCNHTTLNQMGAVYQEKFHVPTPSIRYYHFLLPPSWLLPVQGCHSRVICMIYWAQNIHQMPSLAQILTPPDMEHVSFLHLLNIVSMMGEAGEKLPLSNFATGFGVTHYVIWRGLHHPNALQITCKAQFIYLERDREKKQLCKLFVQRIVQKNKKRKDKEHQ